MFSEFRVLHRALEATPELMEHYVESRGLYEKMQSYASERHHDFYTERLADELLQKYGGDFSRLKDNYKDAVIAALYYRVPDGNLKKLSLPKGVSDILFQLQRLKAIERKVFLTPEKGDRKGIGPVKGNFFSRLSRLVPTENRISRRALLLRSLAVLHSFDYVRSLDNRNQIFLGRAALHHAQVMQALGQGELQSKLEDSAFSVLHPEEHTSFTQVRSKILGNKGDSESRARVMHDLLDKFWKQEFGRDVKVKGSDEGNFDVEIRHRVKEPWSAFRKSRLPEYRKLKPEELPDWHGVRLIFSDRKACLKFIDFFKRNEHNLGYSIHTGSIDDYISHPKPSGYQSWHGLVYLDKPLVSFSVFNPKKTSFEVQIRDRKMHDEAEHGSAATHYYKGSGGRDMTVVSRQDQALFNHFNEERGTLDELVQAPKQDVTTVTESYAAKGGNRKENYDMPKKSFAAELLAQSLFFSSHLRSNPETPFRIQVTSKNGKKSLRNLFYVLQHGDTVEFLPHPKGTKLSLRAIKGLENHSSGNYARLASILNKRSE